MCSGMDPRRSEKIIHIRDQYSYTTLIEKVNGILAVKRWDFAIKEPMPVWPTIYFDGNIIKAPAQHKTAVKKWKKAHEMCLYVLQECMIESDLEATSDFNAAQISQYLHEKYSADREKIGVSGALDCIKSTNIHDGDSLAQASRKIEKLIDAIGVINRAKYAGKQVGYFSTPATVLAIVSMLPESCSTLKHAYFEKELADEHITVEGIRESIRTFYRTAKNKAANDTRQKPTSGVSGNRSRPSPDFKKYGRFCKPCGKRHMSDFEECVKKLSIPGVQAKDEHPDELKILNPAAILTRALGLDDFTKCRAALGMC